MDNQTHPEPRKAAISDLQGCELMHGSASLKGDGTIAFMCASTEIPNPDNDVFLNIAGDRIRITGLRRVEDAGDPEPLYEGQIVKP